jgi:hypothetical protein
VSNPLREALEALDDALKIIDDFDPEETWGLRHQVRHLHGVSLRLWPVVHAAEKAETS